MFGPAREPGVRADRAARGRRRVAPGDARGGVPAPRERALGAHRDPEDLPGGRRGAERRRQRAHPAGDAVRGGVGAAGGRRLGNRGRRGAPRLAPGARAAARRSRWSTPTGGRSTRRTSARPRSPLPASTRERLDDDALFALVAERIAAGDVVGWFQGRMEFGPRALGHRSIVADPRRPDMKDVLNARIKHREPFRPFAPSILAEAIGEWFEQDYPSPYMVLVYKTRIEKRELIPAVNHVDDTGRVQTVTEEASPRFHRLIQRVRAAHRRPDPAQHVVQRERADRDDAPAGGRDVPEDAHGPARARELGRETLRRTRRRCGGAGGARRAGRSPAVAARRG